MTKYYCKRCLKEFSQKSHYDSHNNRKKPCINLLEQNNNQSINNLDTYRLKKLIKNDQELNNKIFIMNTFEDLYNFIQLLNEDSIIHWLEDAWIGKDKQESLLRLFAGLGLIDKLKSYDICKGNFNNKTIYKIDSIKDIFFNNDIKINLKDKGDSSDLTGIHKEHEKHLLITTSKNLNKIQVGKLDIDKLLTNFKQYQDEEYTMSLCICIRNRIDFETMKKNIEKTNHQLKSLLEKEETIIIDWNDLDQAYHQFKIYFGQTPLEKIINSNKPTLILKMHQRLSVLKTLRMKNNSENKKILWGHIQRSGKSYIIGGSIIEDSQDKEECNYLIITTAPNETIDQQQKVLDCIQLKDFNIIVLNGKNKKQPKLLKKNIILCSKQFLQTKMDKGHDKQKYTKEKTRSIKWLKDMKFDMRFLDESHNGGTTELAQKTLENYGNTAFTVQITATYSKPINDYNIPKDCWILWDLEDIKLCKNITKDDSINRLVEKHGEDIRNIINQYSEDNIISEYSKYPELYILTDKINPDVVSEIINNTQDNNYGWSPDACFLLKQSIKKDKETDESEIVIKEEFQKEDENLKLWYRVFGKYNKFGIPDKDYPDDIVFMKRIEKICKDPTIDSRFIGEGDFRNEPMIIMGFLPQNNIDKISKTTIKLLERNNVIPDYEIISINSKITNNPKQSIEDARIKARNSGKKGVLVLTGKQCSLGVSIDNCDIVLLLNNSMGYDMIYQMMFRCMTEGKNKKCGFVVDLNIHRVIDTSVNYASLIKPDIHPRESIKFILQQERLITLNGDQWMPSFGNDVSKITTLCDNIYEIYSSNTEKAINNFLNRLSFKEILLNMEEQQSINNIINYISEKTNKKSKDKLSEEEKIKKGIEKTKVESENISNTSLDTNNENIIEENENIIEEIKINYMDIIKHIIPLICILTIHNKETSFLEMFKYIENDEYIYNILIEQTKSWWGENIDSKGIKYLIELFNKKIKDDKEINNIIIAIKELFIKNIKNTRELSNLIDKYLIPNELEKKSNAEVSTPFKLRQEMLDKIPLDFWTSKKKVFEPCSGKGGFNLDIIDRFMNGLKDVIPDEKERYKSIVEECLYFSDINPTNIFICKLLIDSDNEYKLNYNEGNTLELDIKNEWKIDNFDAVIGNPPYNEDPNNSKDPHMKPVYQDWVYKFNKLSEMLLFITPSKWFSSSDKLLVELREYMKLCNIEFIKHYPEDNVFKDVKIKGGVSYYLINKQFEGKTLFNNSLIDINKYDILVEPKYYDLLTKTNKYNNKNLSELYCSQGTFLNSKTEKELLSTGDVLCYVSKNKGLKKYISKEKINKKFDYWKVITPAAAYKGTSGFSDIYILNDNEIHSRSYISFKVESEEQAKSLYSYLKCKLVQILLSLRKQTHNICNSINFIWIPLLPLNQEWNDNKLYKYFKLTEDNINMIKDIKLDGSYTK